MHHAFAASPIDRADPKRRDPEWLAARLGDAGTRFVQFAGDRPAVHLGQGGAAATILCNGTPIAAPSLDSCVFLGLDDGGQAVFAVPLPVDADGGPAVAPPDEVKFIDLRSLAMQGLLPDGELGILSHGRSMLNWHATHGFCAVCGTRSVMVDGGYRRTCPACGRDHFPRTDPVVIMVAVRGNECLLGRGHHFQPGIYSALAGFVEPGESIEEAARREIHEESGIRIARVTYHSSQPWPFVSSLMIGLMGEALAGALELDGEELEDARWFSRAEARAMLEDRHDGGLKVPMPFAIAHHLIKAFVEGGA